MNRATGCVSGGWRWPARLLVCVGVAATAGPRATGGESDGVEADRITQVSLINSLMLGQYDGFVPLSRLLDAGNFGLGTLDALDGELIVLDGEAYQVRSNGEVREAAKEATTPFAVVTPFGEDGSFACLPCSSLAELDRHLDGAIPSRNNFVAIRIEADLARIVLRSVPRQEKPYRPLVETNKTQTVWRYENVRGTFIGIRSPQWAHGITVPGYHWHFLSADRRLGGHVFDCEIRGGTVRYDVCGDWTVKLDRSESFDRTDVAADLEEQVRNVESLRGDESGRADEPRSTPTNAP